jgi:hypothetical protein
MKTQTVEAEVLEVRAYMTSKSYTAKVYIPIEGCLSMDKMYFNGNTKTEAKQKCLVCGEGEVTAEITFPGGIRSLFLISDIFRELL